MCEGTIKCNLRGLFKKHVRGGNGESSRCDCWSRVFFHTRVVFFDDNTNAAPAPATAHMAATIVATASVRTNSPEASPSATAPALPWSYTILSA